MCKVVSLFVGWLLMLPIVLCAQQPSSSASLAIKVMSYNIRIASPPSKGWGYTDLKAVAGVINREQPDLVALQEVDAFTERSGKSSHQARELGTLTGMHYHFVKAIDRSEGDYGVAVLSRFPILGAESYRLPILEGSEGEVRGCAFIRVDIGGREIGFMSAHLDHLDDRDRLLQVKTLRRILKRYRSIPVIFGADLNMKPDNPILGKLEKSLTHMNQDWLLTFPADSPYVTLDYLMLNRKAAAMVAVSQVAVVHEAYASDHLPLVAVLKIEK